MISAVLPCYNEEGNVRVIYQRLSKVAESMGGDWEFIFVDDHSTDRTTERLRDLATSDRRVKVIRFSRNFGSFTACGAGLEYASGAAAVILSCDGQDPPEDIPRLVAKWKEGHKVVWALRADRYDSWIVKFCSRMYWRIMRRIAFPNIPPAGADMVLLDRQVMDTVNWIQERNAALLGVILWTGFDQAYVEYTKQPRLSGRSKWTLARKIKLAIDSVVSFSHVPITFMSGLGFAVAILGFIYALVVIGQVFLVREIPSGWSVLMVVILLVSGIQMMMLGTLGEYLWRTLDQARSRPLYIVGETLNIDPRPPLRT